jgi:hypothetical protein
VGCAWAAPGARGAAAEAAAEEEEEVGLD